MVKMCCWVQACAIAITLAASGCERRSGSGTAQEIRLGYFANVTHAQAVLGVHSGEFEKAIAPAKLKTKIYNAGPSLVEAMFAGEVDIGYIGPGPAINAYGQSGGKAVRVVGGAAANGVLIVARKDAGISTLADLKGKRVATPEMGNTQDISARHYALSELKQAEARNVVTVPNAEQMSMMLTRQIDAAWVPEPWGSRLVVEAGAVEIAQEKDLWPSGQFTLSVVIVRTEFLREHPDVVEKMLGVHRAWTARLKEEPEKYVPQLNAGLRALTGKSLPPGVLERSVRNVKFTDDPLEQTLSTMARWAHELGFAKQETKLDGLVDMSIMRKLQGADGVAK